MPQTYRVTDPQTGRTVKLTGDSPPTEAELTEIFAKLGGAQSQVQPTQPKSAEQGAIGGFVEGAVKGAANTLVGLGEMVHKIPGVSTVVDAIYGTPGLSKAAFPAAREAVQPTTTAQKVGYGAEQLGEFFIPGSQPGKFAKLGEVARSTGLTLAQTGSPTASTVSGAITAVLPGAGAARRASSMAQQSADKSVAQALGATKEWAKTEAAKLAPEVIKRGIGGSRQAMLDLANEASSRVGAELNTAIKAAAEAGETVSGAAIRDGLSVIRDTFFVTLPTGKRIAIPGTENVVRRLSSLDQFVDRLGADIPVDKAVQVRRVWDKIVDDAGLFGRGASSSADNAGAYATKQASDAFRKLINESPSLEALNKESSFWQGLAGVLQETKQRTMAQGSGLSQAIQSGAGATVGGMFGDSGTDRFKNAVLGGIAGRQVVRLMQSPTWATKVSAPMKHALANALASGSAARVESAARTIMQSVPSQFTQSQDQP